MAGEWKNRGEQSWKGRREEGGRKWRKMQEEERNSKGWGQGCVSLLSCPIPSRGQSLLCFFRDALETSCDWSTCTGLLQFKWQLCLGLLGKKREKHTWGRGDRQGFCHPWSLKIALAAFSNSSEIEVRCFEASFYLARFYSNLPWAQKHSFSICQKVVLLTLKCQTVIGGWIQNWLLQRSGNSQVYSDFFFFKVFPVNLKKRKKHFWNKNK